MDFGRVPYETIDAIDFSLPPDSSFTSSILKPLQSGHKPVIFVGCAKWGRKEWVGKLYPKGTKDADFLNEYVKHFNSIELNATHYQVYGPSAIQKWADKAKGKHFIFCPKVPQAISHYSPLISEQASILTDKFLEGILAFGEHLGPVFLQLSDKFSPAQKNNLYTYLKSLPKDLQFFLELRHPEWFVNKNVRKELLSILHDLNIGFVITDTSGRRDCAHMELTLPKTFIRFVGNSLHKTDYTRIDEWTLRIKGWLENGLKEVYFFMHQHEEAYSPELCVYTIDKLNTVCGLKLKKPGVYGEKAGLLF